MDEIKKLDPKKRTVKKIFREYSKKDEITKPEKKHFYEDFPEKTKEFLENFKQFLIKHKGSIIIIVLVLLIALFLFLIFLPRTPKASFMDNGDPVYGYVYLDDVLLGDTSGEKFKGFPKELCKGIHTVKLESANNAFEWQTYPVDCKTKHIIYNVNHEEALPSQNIIIKFLDKTGSYHIKGNLSFDSVFEQEIDSAFSILREDCVNITSIEFKYAQGSVEKGINEGDCMNNSEFLFRIS